MPKPYAALEQGGPKVCNRLAADAQIRTTNVGGDRYLTFTIVRGGCPLHLWKLS